MSARGSHPSRPSDRQAPRARPGPRRPISRARMAPPAGDLTCRPGVRHARAHRGQPGVCAGARREGPHQGLDGLRLTVEHQVNEWPASSRPHQASRPPPQMPWMALDHRATLAELSGRGAVQRWDSPGMVRRSSSGSKVRTGGGSGQGPLESSETDAKRARLRLPGPAGSVRARAAGQYVGQLPSWTRSSRRRRSRYLDVAGLRPSTRRAGIRNRSVAPENSSTNRSGSGWPGEGQRRASRRPRPDPSSAVQQRRAGLDRRENPRGEKRMVSVGNRRSASRTGQSPDRRSLTQAKPKIRRRVPDLRWRYACGGGSSAGARAGERLRRGEPWRRSSPA